MSAPAGRIGAVRNGDRYMRCVSCRASASVVLTLDGELHASTCERHRALNTRRLAERAAAEGAQ